MAALHRGEFSRFGDMVVDGEGRIYVGLIRTKPEPLPSWDKLDDVILVVEPAAASRAHPDGLVITRGERP